MGRTGIALLVFGVLFLFLFGAVGVAQDSPSGDPESPEGVEPADEGNGGEEAEPGGEEGAPMEEEGGLGEGEEDPGEAEVDFPAEGEEKHELTIGKDGRGELFLSDKSRVRVRASEGGTRFTYFSRFSEDSGYILKLDSGSMLLRLGMNPVRVQVPGGGVVLAGEGAEITVTIEENGANFSRGAEDSGKLTIFADGQAEEIPPGGWLTFSGQGLGESATGGHPPGFEKAPSFVETFHYLTGDGGTGAIHLPGGSLVNLGHVTDLMLAANRSPVPPHFLARMRLGNFEIDLEDETGILLETTHHSFSFRTELHPAESPGEEEGAGEGGGEEESERPPEDRRPGGMAGGFVSIRGYEGDAGVIVTVTEFYEEVINNTGNTLTLENMDKDIVFHVINIGEVDVRLEDLTGEMQTIEKSRKAVGKLSKIFLPPNGHVLIKRTDIIMEEETVQIIEMTAEEIDEEIRFMKEPREPGKVPEVEKPPEVEVPPLKKISEGSIIPPAEEAFKDAGFIQEQQEASPSNP